MNILLIADDLMTRTRLQSAWKAAGADMLAKKTESTPDLIVVDLTSRDAVAHVARLRAAHPATGIMAFGPHVDTEGLKAAKAAGASELVSRGSVVDRVLGQLKPAGA